MKKTFTLIILMVAGMAAGFAQNNKYDQQDRGGHKSMPDKYDKYSNFNNSSLVITSESAKRYVVYVDNQPYQLSGRQRDNTIDLGQLSAGKHYVEVAELKSNFRGKMKEQTIYKSNLFLKSGFETSLLISERGWVNVKERPAHGKSDLYSKEKQRDNRRF